MLHATQTDRKRLPTKKGRVEHIVPVTWNDPERTLWEPWSKAVGTLRTLGEPCGAKLWEPCGTKLWEPCGTKLWEPRRNVGAKLWEPWGNLVKQSCGNLGNLAGTLLGTLWSKIVGTS